MMLSRSSWSTYHLTESQLKVDHLGEMDFDAAGRQNVKESVDA